MSNLVPPHGADSLKPLLLPETERAEELQRAEGLKQVPLSSREVSDLFMLGMGAYTPLERASVTGRRWHLKISPA